MDLMLHECLLIFGKGALFEEPSLSYDLRPDYPYEAPSRLTIAV